MATGSVLVTGANRGIGLEFVKQLVGSETPPRYVFASYRNKDTTQDLEQIRNSSKKCQVVLIQMDVTKKEEVQSARKLVEEFVGEKGLNLLINNAGVLKEDNKSLEEITAESITFHLNTNTLGPFSVFKEMLPLLQKAVKSKENVLKLSGTMVLNISSERSARYIEKEVLENLIGMAEYRLSKVALNTVMRNMALILSMEKRDILIVNMCPGWVNTDLGGEGYQVETSDSISSMLKTLTTLDVSRQGDFMDRHGKPIPY